MKVLLALLLLAGCGDENSLIRLKENPGRDGTSCSTRQDSVGVFVECTDGTDSFIPFPKDGVDGETVVGPAGEAGSDGAPGQSCLLEQRNVTCVHHTKRYKSYLVCPNGELYLKDVRVSNGC